MNETVHVLVHELADSWTGKHQKDSRFGLLDLLAQHTDRVSMVDRSSRGGKVTGSPMPGGADVELLLCEIDAGARELEADLCRVLRWDTIDRGGSRANTIAALHRLPGLVDQLEAEHPAHWLVRGDVSRRGGYRCGTVQRHLSTWHRQARILLGAEQRHALLPYECTADECGVKALRQRPAGGVICGACGETYTDDELHEWFVLTQEETQRGLHREPDRGRRG
jgi:hypothetical protein